MASNRNRLSEILEPFTRLPDDGTLALVTGVLDATPYWLVPQFLAAALSTPSADAGNEQRTAVVLVSWMRDLEFWNLDCKKSLGLELGRLAEQQQFAFIDGLSTVYKSDKGPESKGQGNDSSLDTIQRPTANARSTTLPHRGPLAPPGRVTSQADDSVQSLGHHILDRSRSQIAAAIGKLRSNVRNARVILVVDSPTVLLATTSIIPAQLGHFMLSLRQLVHSTVLISEADASLIRAANPGAFERSEQYHQQQQSPPLETDHAAFLVGQAHQAALVLSTRPLDSGVARDVSGVLLITRGGGWDVDVDNNVDADQLRSAPTNRREIPSASGLEVLYHMLNDGKVSVFERGSRDAG